MGFIDITAWFIYFGSGRGPDKAFAGLVYG